MLVAAGIVGHVSFWAVARQPRMIALLLVFLLAAGGCGWLGKWQLDRAFQRAELAAVQEAREQASAAPAGLGEVLEPQQSFPGSSVGRQVEVSGEYEGERQLLVAGRAGPGGETGYLVLTPLRVSDDGTAGESWADLSGSPVLAVVRGWVAEPDAADEPPSDTVTVTGWLQAGEASTDAAAVATAADPSGNDDPIVHGIALSALVQQWGGPIYSGYLVDSDAEAPLDHDASTNDLIRRYRHGRSGDG